MESYKLSDIISIQSGFKAAISINDDLQDNRKIEGYIPTTNGVLFLEEIYRSLDITKSSRPIMLTGTYGTGKSHLGLITAALITDDKRDAAFKTVSDKIKDKWQDKSNVISRMRDNFSKKPFLFVYLEAERIDFDTGFINNSLILALKDALRHYGLSELTPNTAYDSAVQRIAEIKNDYPSNYKELERKIAEKGYFSIENLIAKLNSHEKKALEEFSALHKEVCAGAEFNIYANISADIAYKSVVEEIKKHGYGGILVIWDEFTPVLRKLVADPESGEALNFQKFAEMCAGSGRNKVIFVTISHRTIEETIDIVAKESLKGDISKAAEKISGRFKSISLGHIDTEAYHLMGGIILHDSKYNEIKLNYNEKFLDIKGAIKKSDIFYNLNDADLDVIVYNLYPLHPTTTFVLSHLSDRIGQRNRSIFTYLCDSGETTFGAFLDKNIITGKKIPFILPKDIIEYFLPIMKTTQDDKDIRKMTRAYLDRKMSIDQKDILSEDVLKTVLLFNSTRAVPATDENIIYSLGAFTNKEKEDIKEKLQELRERRILKKRLSDNGWHFYGLGTDTSIDDHLLEIIRETERSWTLKELFNNAIDKIRIKAYLTTIEADDYNTERDIKRKIDLEFVMPQELNNPHQLFLKIPKNYLDGGYCLILATNEAEGSFAIQKISTDLKNVKNVLLSVPSDYSVLNELSLHLKRLRAFDLLSDKYPIYKNELQEELITEQSDTTKYLKEKLEHILEPMNGLLHFYYKGEKLNISAINQLRKLVSEMMNETFPYTPAIAREELVDDGRSDTLRKYRIPLIDAILTPDAPRILINEKDSTKQHLIEVFYKRHGILRKTKGREWTISKPDVDNEMAKIWGKIDTFIHNTVPTNLIDLIEELRILPYGLKKKTIGPIIAVVIRQYILDNQLVFYWKGNPVDKITGDLIEDKIINKRQEVKVSFHEVTEKHKLILSSITKVFSIEFNDIESIYRGVVNWWRSLPPYTRNTAKIDEGMKKIKEAFFIPLSSDEKDKKELFNSVLPDLLGLEDLSSIPTTQIEDLVINKMSGIKKSFENIIERLNEEIKSSVEECIGNKESRENYFKKVASLTNNTSVTGDSRKLMQWLETSIKNEGVNETVLAEEILGRIDNWTDEFVVKLKGHIESAKNTVESFLVGEVTSETRNEIIFNTTGKKLHRYFNYYEHLEKAPNKTQSLVIYELIKSHIEKNIKNGQLTEDELISIIYKLLIEVLDNA